MASVATLRAPDRPRSLQRLRSRGLPFWWLPAAAAAGTYLLIVVGAVVRVTGSGLGCPDWPTCHGQLLPPLRVDAIIEYSHRLTGAVVSTLIVAVPVAAWLWRRQRAVLVTATLIPVLLACQIVLGAIVVWLELAPMAVLVHLGFAVLIFAGMIWITVQAAPPPALLPAPAAAAADQRLRGGHYSLLLAMTTATLFVLILIGAYTRATGASWACVGFPGCATPAGIEALEGVNGSGLVQIHLTHRFAAYVASVLVVASVAETWRLRRGVPAMGRVAALLLVCLVAQVFIGAAAVSTGLPTFLRGAHVAGAAAVWGAAVLLLALHVRAGQAEAALLDEPAAAATSTAAGVARAAVPASVRLRAFVSLTKPKVILLLEVPTLAAMLIAGTDWPSPLLVVATLLGGAMAAGGAAAINCYLDRDIDEVMGQRTRKRAIPAGLVSPGEALAFGCALAVGSFVLLAAFANLLAAFLAQAALLVYVFVYTSWMKRSTPSNIVIGGAAGAIPPLVGWAAVTGEVGPAAWMLFAVIFFWTPPHFWSLSLLIKQHYERAGVPMLPVVRGDEETRRQIIYYSLQMIAVTVLVFALGLSGLFYLLSALLLGGIFLYFAAQLWREASARAASRLFHYSMLYLWLLCAALVLDRRVFF